MTPVRAGAAVLCLVTPGHAVDPQNSDHQPGGDLDVIVREAVRAGVDFLQIREPHLPAALLVDIVVDAVKASRGTQTRILVNDRVDVALAAGADGVHLGARSLPPSRVRLLAPASFVLGRSVHSVEEAREIDAENNVDFLIAGTVFPSASKPHQAQLLGLEGLAAVVSGVRVPVLAIGGMRIGNLASVARTGAAGFAAIQLFGDAVAGSHLHDLVALARKTFDTARVIP